MKKMLYIIPLFLVMVLAAGCENEVQEKPEDVFLAKSEVISSAALADYIKDVILFPTPEEIEESSMSKDMDFRDGAKFRSSMDVWGGTFSLSEYEDGGHVLSRLRRPGKADVLKYDGRLTRTEDFDDVQKALLSGMDGVMSRKPHEIYETRGSYTVIEKDYRLDVETVQHGIESSYRIRWTDSETVDIVFRLISVSGTDSVYEITVDGKPFDDVSLEKYGSIFAVLAQAVRSYLG